MGVEGNRVELIKEKFLYNLLIVNQLTLNYISTKVLNVNVLSSIFIVVFFDRYCTFYVLKLCLQLSINIEAKYFLLKPDQQDC